ncbi:MAG TPA: Flp pilus assembly protein CpaB [Allosphingosinicella sp.]|jgi:pilus assembly protein CpaB
MDVKKLVLLIGALVVAAVTAVTARKMFSGSAAPAAVAAAPVPVGPEVLVATRTLPVGTIIDAEALHYQRWPEALVQPAYFIKGRPGPTAQSLIGTVVRNEISAGQPLPQGSVVKPGERGFLAAALSPGMRAVTVPVSVTSGVAGFIFPGDRVDIVLTQQVAGGGEGLPLKVSETIMRNMRVLATNQRMAPSQDKEGKPVVEPFSLVTFEASPKMAEKIAVAQTIGQLSLSLRSLADTSADLQKALASGEAVAQKGPGGRVLLPVANEPIDTRSTYTVGAEVSRFQRSTVPSKGGSKDDKSNPADQWAKAMGSFAGALSGGKPQGGPAAPAVPTGPVVRVARGNSITIVPVGAK